MESTYGISMRNLDEIDETHTVCALTSYNYSNYERIYNLMKGVLQNKINNPTLWMGYDQGQNKVKSNLLGYDGFDVTDDVLSDILPKLNINSAKISTIQQQSYNNMEEDNSYS